MTSSRGSLRRYVLDANALIGFFEGRETAAGKVRLMISEALRLELPLLMSAVNWGEVYYMEWRYHGEAKAREVEAYLYRLPIAVIAADLERATRAATLKQKTSSARTPVRRPRFGSGTPVSGPRRNRRQAVRGAVGSN